MEADNLLWMTLARNRTLDLRRKAKNCRIRPNAAPNPRLEPSHTKPNVQRITDKKETPFLGLKIANMGLIGFEGAFFVYTKCDVYFEICSLK
jgi:hypothetical protein